MIVSVRESKARLSELLAKAMEGEEVVITVRGEPTAKIVPVQAPADKSDLRAWVAERRGALGRQLMPQPDSSGAILDELRADRF
jgi:prevent-host-death family protein